MIKRQMHFCDLVHTGNWTENLYGCILSNHFCNLGVGLPLADNSFSSGLWSVTIVNSLSYK